MIKSIYDIKDIAKDYEHIKFQVLDTNIKVTPINAELGLWNYIGTYELVTTDKLIKLYGTQFNILEVR